MKLATAAIPFAFVAALALSACSDNESDNLAGLGNDADPALTSALNDQILVDPDLANQSNRNAVRPPATPLQAAYPPPEKGDGAAASAAAAVQGNGCSDPAKFDYNNNWAGRLSPAFAVYPGGKLSEAAGNDKDGCRTRVASFAAADGWQRVLDWYHTRAVKAGYSSEHQVREGDHILAGTSKDGGAFYLIVTPKGAGSEVSLITNHGR